MAGQPSRHGAAGNESVIICGLFPYDRVQVTEAKDIHFDGWVLRPSSGELLRDGSTQRLAQQPLRMLVELLEHPGEVVPRERLVQVLWPQGIVDFDNSLNAVVRKLRVALGDDSETPRYIETLPRIGYRFIGSVSAAPKEAPTASTAPRFRWKAVAVAGVVAVLASVVWWEAQQPRTLAGPVASSATAAAVAPINVRTSCTWTASSSARVAM
jgi:DNA-binding winged helix-turn-helix (wHTH) protein